MAYSQPGNQGPLILKSVLLAFHALHGRHTGGAIADIVYALLERAGLTGDVYVTMTIPLSFPDSYIRPDTGRSTTRPTMVHS